MGKEDTANREVVHYRTCPLCEATCGLEIHTVENEIVHIQGDALDPFSRGYLCPKGYSLKSLHEDPDRIRRPMIREGQQWREVSWMEAFTAVRNGLRPLMERYGPNSIGTYLGNPNVHTLAGQFYVPLFLRALGSQNRFSASTMDQIPKQFTAELLYGSDFTIPIPDVDRTEYFLIIGANPLVSNGSLLTAPNMRARLKGIQQRGGKVVVIDPMRTLTAKQADEHHFIRPGTDALFLFAILHTLFSENLLSLDPILEYTNGIEEIRELCQHFTPETVESHCAVPADVIRRMAREFAGSPHAVAYGRMGTCTQSYGTLTSWLVEVLNCLTGNLDREGGALFTTPAAGGKRGGGKSDRSARYGRFHSRVRKLPEILGELPVVCMAEEMEAPGPDQIRAMITIAGNPVLSAPNGNRLLSAMQNLEFMVSVDCYLNETTSQAHVFLPAPSPLEKSHYDLAFYQLAVRNIAHFSKPVYPMQADQLDEWEILLHLTAAVMEEPPNQPCDDLVMSLDNFAMLQMIKQEVKQPGSPVANWDPTNLLSTLSTRRGPQRMLDFLLRVGPNGDHFGQNPDGLTLDQLESHPHGIDLGPLKPRLSEVLRTASGKVELAPPLLLEDARRLLGELQKSSGLPGLSGLSVLSDLPDRQIAGGEFTLIGRRHLRSNNSWMHNLEVLVKGEDRCTLLMHPLDAKRVGVQEGEYATVVSRTGQIEVPVQITEDVMPGVVSMPHGYGHHQELARLQVAKQHAGINLNLLTDDEAIDPVSGNAILNGTPVRVYRRLSVS